MVSPERRCDERERCDSVKAGRHRSREVLRFGRGAEQDRLRLPGRRCRAGGTGNVLSDVLRGCAGRALATSLTRSNSREQRSLYLRILLQRRALRMLDDSIAVNT